MSQGDDADALCGDVVDGKLCVHTPLSIAATEGLTKICKILLQAGANPSGLISGEGTSAVYVAFLDGQNSSVC